MGDRGIIYDAVIIGARPGGRTAHARHIENYLGLKSVSGIDLINAGIAQAESFNVKIIKDVVREVKKNEYFSVSADNGKFLSRFVIASSGVRENYPKCGNIQKFIGAGFFTCVDCDGYKATGKKLVVMSDSIKGADLALAVKEMFTPDIKLIINSPVPPEYAEELRDEGIEIIYGNPVNLLGDGALEAVELESGARIPCEAVMSAYGYRLNDGFLSGLDLKKDGRGFKYLVNAAYESYLSGLYIVGPLNLWVFNMESKGSLSNSRMSFWNLLLSLTLSFILLL